jgi:hypothetical protein
MIKQPLPPPTPLVRTQNLPAPLMRSKGASTLLNNNKKKQKQKQDRNISPNIICQIKKKG